MSENKSFDELLLSVRNDIDRIDKELLKLFTERMQCAERVAEIKRKAGIPVLNAAREQVILDGGRVFPQRRPAPVSGAEADLFARLPRCF